MAEYIKQLGSNLLERLVIALLTAVMTTFILTQRQESRITVLERDVTKLQIENAEERREEQRRYEAIMQRLEHISTVVSIYMDKEKQK